MLTMNDQDGKQTDLPVVLASDLEITKSPDSLSEEAPRATIVDMSDIPITKETNTLEEPALSTVTESGVNASNSIGSYGFKAPPKCENPSLRKEATSFSELSQFTFDELLNADVDKDWHEKIQTNQSSRQGRESQRWQTTQSASSSVGSDLGTSINLVTATPNTLEMIRLVTGCVPILRGERVLFVSSSRKPEWILPKGGWEQDETMEESATRECYEEAGVLGRLGPRLSEIQYETRKGKQRRLEAESKSSENAIKNSKVTLTGAPASGGMLEAQVEPLPVQQNGVSENVVVDSIKVSSASSTASSTSTTSTLSSTPQKIPYSLVKMTLFPLYVSEIKESWPESGRFRRAVHIDEAIEMLKSRPEFHTALTEVRNKNLHKFPSL